MNKHTQTTVMQRYSDFELAEFKEIVLAKIELFKNDLIALEDIITGKSENGTQDTQLRYAFMENGAETSERNKISDQIIQKKSVLYDLNCALVRIENKTYGVCRETGKLIDKARLKAVPHTTLSIEAKSTQHLNSRKN